MSTLKVRCCIYVNTCKNTSISQTYYVGPYDAEIPRVDSTSHIVTFFIRLIVSLTTLAVVLYMLRDARFHGNDTDYVIILIARLCNNCLLLYIYIYIYIYIQYYKCIYLCTYFFLLNFLIFYEIISKFLENTNEFNIGKMCMCIVHCTVYIVYCTNNVHVQCTTYNVQCSLYTICTRPSYAILYNLCCILPGSRIPDTTEHMSR